MEIFINVLFYHCKNWRYNEGNSLLYGNCLSNEYPPPINPQLSIWKGAIFICVSISLNYSISWIQKEARHWPILLCAVSQVAAPSNSVPHIAGCSWFRKTFNSRHNRSTSSVRSSFVLNKKREIPLRRNAYAWVWVMTYCVYLLFEYYMLIIVILL